MIVVHEAQLYSYPLLVTTKSRYCRLLITDSVNIYVYMSGCIFVSESGTIDITGHDQEVQNGDATGRQYLLHARKLFTHV